jgi:hypothetical protein
MTLIQRTYAMKARKTLLLVASLGLSATYLVPAASVAEEDFSRYTNEELAQKQAQVRDMSEADRALFRAEMQKRSQAMSQGERDNLGIGGPRGASTDEQRATRAQGRVSEDNERGVGELVRERERFHSVDGIAQGDVQAEQQRQRMSEDNERGQGELKRDRQHTENVRGYGRGYESRQRDSGSRRGGGGRRGG